MDNTPAFCEEIRAIMGIDKLGMDTIISIIKNNYKPLGTIDGVNLLIKNFIKKIDDEMRNIYGVERTLDEILKIMDETIKLEKAITTEVLDNSLDELGWELLRGKLFSEDDINSYMDDSELNYFPDNGIDSEAFLRERSRSPRNKESAQEKWRKITDLNTLRSNCNKNGALSPTCIGADFVGASFDSNLSNEVPSTSNPAQILSRTSPIMDLIEIRGLKLMLENEESTTVIEGGEFLLTFDDLKSYNQGITMTATGFNAGISLLKKYLERSNKSDIFIQNTYFFQNCFTNKIYNGRSNMSGGAFEIPENILAEKKILIFPYLSGSVVNKALDSSIGHFTLFGVEVSYNEGENLLTLKCTFFDSLGGLYSIHRQREGEQLIKSFINSVKSPNTMVKWTTMIYDVDVPQQMNSHICGKIALMNCFNLAKGNTEAKNFDYIKLLNSKQYANGEEKNILFEQIIQDEIDQIQLKIYKGNISNFDLNIPNIQEDPQAFYSSNQAAILIENELENESEYGEANKEIEGENVNVNQNGEENEDDEREQLLNELRTKYLNESHKNWVYCGDIDSFITTEAGNIVRTSGKQSLSEESKFRQIIMKIEDNVYTFIRAGIQDKGVPGKGVRTNTSYRCANCKLQVDNQYGLFETSPPCRFRFNLNLVKEGNMAEKKNVRGQKGDKLMWHNKVHHPRCSSLDKGKFYDDDRQIFLPRFASIQLAEEIKKGINNEKKIKKNYSIYLLFDDNTKQPFYLGKSYSLYNRWNQHKNDKRWKKQGKIIKMSPLIINLNALEVLEMEILLHDALEAALNIRLESNVVKTDKNGKVIVPIERYEKIELYKVFIKNFIEYGKNILYLNQTIPNEELMSNFKTIDDFNM